MAQDEPRSTERQLLENLLVEREELDRLIELLQKRAGLKSTQTQNSNEVESALAVQKGEFFGMSRPEATIALLKKLRRTLSTNEILEALQDSGLDFSGKNTLSALYTSLSRAPELRRVARNTWGLKEWYPHLKDAPIRERKKQEPEPAIEQSADSQAQQSDPDDIDF